MTFPAQFDLADLDGSNGFIINGIDERDLSGSWVSNAGDINGDGLDDIIIGAYGADPNGESSGESYVVFGSRSGFNSALDLSSLDGTNGFVINGVAAGDLSGGSVSNAGDVNGDGLDDLIIGAESIETRFESFYSSKSYVVFGSSSGFGSALDLSSLNGTNGFAINGIDVVEDKAGYSVSSAGDINGDGIDDLIIGASLADSNGYNSGASYIVFGSRSGFSSAFELSSLNGTNGFVINSIDAYSYTGYSVSGAGDVNGDGIDDVIVGATAANSSGQSYVVFGNSSGFESVLELSNLDGTNGFVIDGAGLGSYTGFSVSGAGDVNGDGIDDVIIGAPFYDSGLSSSFSLPGQSYVVFGNNSGFDTTLDLNDINGDNGFVIVNDGLNDFDSLASGFLGWSVSGTGDINGDGIDDVIVGSDRESYVIFGRYDGFSRNLTLSSLNGSNGFAFNSSRPNSVSGAGDINGDGIDDAIVGVRSASPNGRSSGQSYVIFGIAANAAPDAVDDTVTTDEDTLLSGSVFADNGSGLDTDPNGDTLTITQVNGSAASVGTQITLSSGALVTLNADGSFDYDPNGQFEALTAGDTATDSFDYTLSDGTLTDSATVTIAIAGVNEPTPPGTLVGTSGKDTLIGGRGRNTLFGLADNDFLDGGNGRDFLFGGDDGDILIGGKGNDSLFGEQGNDFLNGGNGRDFLDGGNGKDILLGGAGNDILLGGVGKDTLIGGKGNDVLTGGNGRDTFVLAVGEGADTITDFSSQDRIGLAGGLGIGDLSFSGNNIFFTDTNEVLATLTGVDTTSLNNSQFVLI